MKTGLSRFLKGTAKPPAESKAGTPTDKRAGPALAARLNELIDEQANDDRDRDQIIDDMAEAAGIERSTVLQILGGEVDCPPTERLEAFAGVLDVSAEELFAAGEQDGRQYAAGDEDGEEQAKAAVARIAGILRSEEAKGRIDLAMSLALDSTMSEEEARKVLGSTPKSTPRGRLSAEMAAVPQPAVSPSGGAPKAASLDAAEIYANRRKAVQG